MIVKLQKNTDRSAPAKLLYRVEWENTVTGQRGCGKLFSLEVAQLTADALNRIFPKIRHWVGAVQVPAGDEGNG